MKRFAVSTLISLAWCSAFGTGDANAIPLQELLDGGSLKVDSWLIKNWSLSYTDIQSLDSSDFANFKRDFGNIDVIGSVNYLNNREFLMVNLKLDGNYWASGWSLFDEFTFTVQSLDPHVGIVFGDNYTPNSFRDWVLSGQDNAYVYTYTYNEYIWPPPSPSYPDPERRCYGHLFNVNEDGGNYYCGYHFYSTDLAYFAYEPEIVLEHGIGVSAFDGRWASLGSSGFTVIGEFQSTPVRADEPATLGLLGVGLIGVTLARWRRRTLQSHSHGAI